jgi:cytidylate kinase
MSNRHESAAGGQPTGRSDQHDRNGRNVVALDGPAASGKTTVAAHLADRLGAVFLDTGLLYRAATLMAQRMGLTAADELRISMLIDGGAVSIRPATVADGRRLDVALNGEDVTTMLRAPEIDAAVSAISALPSVRAALMPLQRSFARDQRVIMAGRDIASVIFPDAAVKVYLDASLEERARRRWLELVVNAPMLTQNEVESELRRRDEIDSTRETAPLQVAEEAVIVQTDFKSIQQVVDEVAAIVERAWGVA